MLMESSDGDRLPRVRIAEDGTCPCAWRHGGGLACQWICHVYDPFGRMYAGIGTEQGEVAEVVSKGACSMGNMDTGCIGGGVVDCKEFSIDYSIDKEIYGKFEKWIIRVIDRLDKAGKISKMGLYPHRCADRVRAVGLVVDADACTQL